MKNRKLLTKEQETRCFDSLEATRDALDLCTSMIEPERRLLKLLTQIEQNIEAILGHTLIVVSLHDASARCSCGGWEFTGTGDWSKNTLLNRLRHAHRQHVEIMAKPMTMYKFKRYMFNDPDGLPVDYKWDFQEHGRLYNRIIRLAGFRVADEASICRLSKAWNGHRKDALVVLAKLCYDHPFAVEVSK